MTKICKRCNEVFDAASNRQAYCSSECRFGTAECEGCAVIFQRSDAGQRFHSVRCWYEFTAKRRSRICRNPGCENVITKQGRGEFCSLECWSEDRRIARLALCEECKEPFDQTIARRRFCSRHCAMMARAEQPGRGYRSPLGSTRTEGSGYVMVKTEGGWTQQHRVVMAEVLGRPLDPNERIHHRNGKRDDNRPENLELWRVKTKDPAGVRAADYHCHGCRCGEE